MSAANVDAYPKVDEPLRLHLGCGSTRLPDHVNVDAHAIPGVTDLVVDLDPAPPLSPPVLPYADDSVDEIFSSHFIEHLHQPLRLMQELWRVAKPGARNVFRCPYGSSDDADEDPTHVRRLFLHSWGYFGQPYHWRSAGYGYSADWQVKAIQLVLYPEVADQIDGRVDGLQLLNRRLRHERNIVMEMIAELVAMKPARERRRELQEAPEVTYARGVSA